MTTLSNPLFLFFEQRPAYGPSAVRRVSHLNAVHKVARLRHRNLDKEQRTIVLLSGVSFSFDYAAMIPSVNRFHLKQSAVFSPVFDCSASHCLISEVPLPLFAPVPQSKTGRDTTESVQNGTDFPSSCD